MSYQELSFRMVKLNELDELENYLTRRTSMETNQNVNVSCSSIGQAFEGLTPIQSNRHGKKTSKHHKKKRSRH